MTRETCYNAPARVTGLDSETRSMSRGWPSQAYPTKRQVGRVSCLEARVRMTLDQEARFWSKVVADPGSGCWHWGGAVNEKGYGQVGVRGRTRRAHRVMWEHERGPIPDGLQIDHLCRNHGCVNPAHLEPVTQRENLMRGFSPSAMHARKTHCVNGHEFTPENTRRYLKSGTVHRACRECNRLLSARPRLGRDFLTTSATESREAKGGKA